MIKIKCRICGDIGYTAAPKALVCKCGGRFRIIREKKEDRLAKVDSAILELFDFSDLLNYGNN